MDYKNVKNWKAGLSYTDQSKLIKCGQVRRSVEDRRGLICYYWPITRTRFIISEGIR